jgi:hypothetical protein
LQKGIYYQRSKLITSAVGLLLFAEKKEERACERARGKNYAVDTVVIARAEAGGKGSARRQRKDP